jgi:deoxycytidine triphosphate deaminase
VWKIERPVSAGKVTTKGKELPKMEEVKLDSDGYWHLPPGAYLGYINEEINLPKGISALVIQRSTLARSEVYHSTSSWDSGYNGKGTVSIIVDNPYGFIIEKNSRVVQMHFFLVEGENFSYSEKGHYQKENIEENTIIGRTLITPGFNTVVHGVDLEGNIIKEVELKELYPYPYPR